MYETYAVGVDVTGISGLVGVTEAITEAYGLAMVVLGPLMFSCIAKEKHVTDLDDIPEEYYRAVRLGGLYIAIRIPRGLAAMYNCTEQILLPD